jgi:hypothetical protein
MEKRFQHSASAYGIGGKFLWPINETMVVRPSVDLPPTGGFGQDIEKNYNFHELVSFSRAYTEVSGSPNVEVVDGKSIPAENNLSLTVVEDFNLLHVVEVKKMVSRITTRYFHGAEDVEVVLWGTRYEGFRIFGHEIVVKLELRIDGSTKQTTIVEEIIVPPGHLGFTVDKNTIDIPHVGRLFLGELTVEPNSKSLNLIRWELGCPSGGDGTIGGGQGGGSPPAQ